MSGLLILIPLGGCAKGEQKTITAFCGSASKPAMEEAAKVFEEKTGIKVYLNFGGSGAVLSQMKLSRSGDLYIPGSPDYMAMAEDDGVVEPGSVKIISYLVPAILVQHGNPKDIQTLSDLAQPGIKVGLADPESVSIGLYAYEILEYNNLLREVGENIVTYGESYSKIVSLVALPISPEQYLHLLKIERMPKDSWIFWFQHRVKRFSPSGGILPPKMKLESLPPMLKLAGTINSPRAISRWSSRNPFEGRLHVQSAKGCCWREGI